MSLCIVVCTLHFQFFSHILYFSEKRRGKSWQIWWTYTYWKPDGIPGPWADLKLFGSSCNIERLVKCGRRLSKITQKTEYAKYWRPSPSSKILEGNGLTPCWPVKYTAKGDYPIKISGDLIWIFRIKTLDWEAYGLVYLEHFWIWVFNF